MTSPRSPPPPPPPAPRRWTVGAGGCGVCTAPATGGAWRGLEAGPAPALAEAPRSLPQTRGRRPGCGAAAEVDRGRAQWAWPEGVARREAGPGRRLCDSRAAAAEAAGWPCARVGRRLGSGGSACGAAARVERPRLARRLQRGRRAPRSRRGPGTGDPRGNPAPSRVGGAGAPTPGRRCGRRTAPGSGPGPGQPPPGGLRSVAPAPGAVRGGQSCGRAPRAAPRAVATGLVRARGAADPPASPRVRALGELLLRLKLRAEGLGVGTRPAGASASTAGTADGM